MNFLKWLRLLGFILRILKLLNRQSKQKIELLDKNGKEIFAKTIADEINEAGKKAG